MNKKILNLFTCINRLLFFIHKFRLKMIVFIYLSTFLTVDLSSNPLYIVFIYLSTFLIVDLSGTFMFKEEILEAHTRP